MACRASAARMRASGPRTLGYFPRASIFPCHRNDSAGAQLSASWGYLKVKAIAVGQLVGFVPGLGVLNLFVRQHRATLRVDCLG